MEEDKIKELFSSYDPELSSSLAFMERLERNMEAVEFIHRENEAIMKRNRLAVAIASVAGFVTGVIFTLLYPYILALVETSVNSLLAACQIPGALYGIHIITWLIIGAIAVGVALNTYSISISLRPLRCGRRGD